MTPVDRRCEFIITPAPEFTDVPSHIFSESPRGEGWGYCDSIRWSDGALVIRDGDVEVIIPTRYVMMVVWREMER